MIDGSPPTSEPRALVRRKRSTAWFLVVSLVLVGAFLGFIGLLGDGVPPDPNEPDEAGFRQLDIVEREVTRAYQQLALRTLSHEITQRQKDEFFLTFVRDRALSLDRAAMAPSEAHRYGEVYRAAKMWPEAHAAYLVAVKDAGLNQDRRVIGALRLAESDAHLGRAKEAVQWLLSTFDAPPGNKPPILLATYLEIAPALYGQIPNSELADLIDRAAAQHEQAIVVPDSASGTTFLAARPYHIQQARRLAARLRAMPTTGREPAQTP